MPPPSLQRALLPALSRVRRVRRGLARRLGRRRLDLYYDEAYRLDLPGVAHDPLRAERILVHLESRGLLGSGWLHRPYPVSMKGLLEVHEADYLESLREPRALTRVLGLTLDPALQDRVLDLQRHMTGGTWFALRRALATGGVAVNLGGGFHHAFADRGARFCVFNDVAVAIAKARRRGLAGRVLVVDLDLHDGDGTRSLFADDETVHTFSIHNETNDAPFTHAGDAVEATTIELGGGVGDDELLDVLGERLGPVVERFGPEAVVYLAGTDPAADDEIGDWKMSGPGILARDRLVVETVGASPWGRRPGGSEPVPLAITLAGGYGPGSWRYTARFLDWLASGGEPPEPESTAASTLARYRRLARRLSPRQLTGTPRGAGEGGDLGLTAEDILGDLAGAPARSRFLGYYSRHGIELAMERAGILDRLRALGFQHPNLVMDLSGEGGDTLRLFGDFGPGDEPEELLMELRVRRDRTVAPPFELLRVEWLLLQNPRARFTAERAPLPGQEHPGLGMLEDVVAFLVLACDRLGLDGIVFVPSHYHLAAQARTELRFLAPEAEARFRTFERALAGRPLGEATHRVDAGRVVDAESGESIAWKPAPMVLPVSERLRERVGGEEYERRVSEAGRWLGFRVAED